MAKIRQLASILLALTLGIAVVVGAFHKMEWQAMVVLAWYSAILLGKRGIIESMAICFKIFNANSKTNKIDS